jgi:hypothetical protein
VLIESLHGAAALPWCRELQRAPHLLNDITALIVGEVVLALELGRLTENLRQAL